MTGAPKILLWDIETSYIIAYVFGLYDQNLSHENIKQDWFIICSSWKWLGEDKIHSVAATSPTNDRNVITKMHQVISQADAIVHHNGDQFDLKKFNARAIQYGLTPLPDIRQIDTLKIARRKFKFTSNRLDYLAQYLGIGKKMDTPKGLWKLATEGNRKAIKEMVEYNKRDVALLESVYDRLKPYVPAAINMNNIIDGGCCPSCASANTQRRGFFFLARSKYQRHQCTDCGKWFKGKLVRTAQLGA